MAERSTHTNTAPTVEERAKKILEQEYNLKSGSQGRFKKLLPFLGPAFIASVAYIDPGNFATNIQGGAQFGYTLVWVIIASNLIAVLVQMMSAKLGIATGLNLAEHCRERYPLWFSRFFWILMEIVIMATDLAEFVGASVAIYLLFGFPLWIGAIITAVATFLILGLERFGFRPLEAVIAAFVAVVALCYIIEIFLAKPEWAAIAGAIASPKLPNREAVLISVGILGATVMPHAVFLHSALTQNRIRPQGDRALKRLFRYEILDVVLAMGIAGFVNAAMLIMAAATFFYSGHDGVGSIEEAYKTLTPLLGGMASLVFGVSLLASGLSSSAVGTSAGQIIMQGFIRRKIPIWLRRIITIIPAMVVILMGLDPMRTLVISQVLLSFGLPLTIFSLLIFTSNKKIMGNLVNRPHTTVLLAIAAGVVSFLNLYLIYMVFAGT